MRTGAGSGLSVMGCKVSTVSGIRGVIRLMLSEGPWREICVLFTRYKHIQLKEMTIGEVQGYYILLKL